MQYADSPLHNLATAIYLHYVERGIEVRSCSSGKEFFGLIGKHAANHKVEYFGRNNPHKLADGKSTFYSKQNNVIAEAWREGCNEVYFVRESFFKKA